MYKNSAKNHTAMLRDELCPQLISSLLNPNAVWDLSERQCPSEYCSTDRDTKDKSIRLRIDYSVGFGKLVTNIDIAK